MIYGSSVVILKGTGSTGGFTGATGPTGGTGPTGADGSSIQGSKGNSGYGVESGSFDGYGIATINIGGTGSVNLNLVGPTGITENDAFVVLKGPAINPGFFSILYGDNAENNRNEVLAKYEEETKFRRINFVGVPSENIQSVTVNGTQIIVQGKTFNSSGGVDGLPLGEQGQVLYLISNSGARGAPRTLWGESNNTLHLNLNSQISAFEDFDSTNFRRTFDTPFSKNISAGDTGSGIFQQRITDTSINSNLRYLRTVDEGGTYIDGQYLQQDDQMRFYSGSTGSVVLDWKFPTTTIKRITPTIAQNAFEEVDGNQKVLRSTTLATTINREVIGSCCACPGGDTESTKCIDYVHRNYCISIGGQFSTDACATRVSTGDCFPEGSCCVNNKCINTTFELCKKYNGIFFTNQYCSTTIVDGQEQFKCPSSCPILGCCCVNGKGYDLTQAECSLIENSLFTGATCSSLSTDFCCNAANFKGACCRGDCCDQKAPDDCLEAGGIFMGVGKKCEEINCCGVRYTPPYFDPDADLDDQRCRATFQDPCYEMGTNIGGGHLVGIIGEPNACNNFGSPMVAFGEPLECMCNPRGLTIPQWQFRNCKVYLTSPNGNGGGVRYFARTYPKYVSSKELGGGCLLRQGTPFIQQLIESKTANITNVERTINWPDSAFFKGSSEYNQTYAPYAFDSQTCNIITDIVGLGSPGAILYKKLASKFYEANQLHILWALIVAPYDISYQEGTSKEFEFKWSEMFESRVGPGTEILSTGNLFLEPIATSPIDGLLNTRLHDAWSTENPEVWFSPNSINNYYRWVSQLQNLWPDNRPGKIGDLDFEDAIAQNLQTFKTYYRQMWESKNPENTVIRQVSKLNSTSFNGFSDWYIPSIIEMNYIAGALGNNFNEKIKTYGGQSLQNTRYWTSTSMCRIKNWSQTNPTLKDYYEIENIDEQTEDLINNRNRFLSSEYGLSEEESFNLSHQICNGMGMLVQDFSEGAAIYNVKRNRQYARFRPVRRIPIIYGSTDINIVDVYSDYNFKKCLACEGYPD
jgi:hypothetical protein